MKQPFLFILLIIALNLFSQANNPFDINRENTRVITSPTVDTLSMVIDEDSMSFASPGVQKDIGGNPFNIGENSIVSNRPQVDKTQKIKKEKAAAKNVPVNHLAINLSLVLSLIVISFAITLNRVRINKMLRSTYNSNVLKTLYRSVKTALEPQGALLYLAFVINISLFIYMIVAKGQFGMSIVNMKWWWLPSIIALIYFGRHIAMSLFSFVFPIDQSVDLHNYSIGVHNMIIGILLLPIVVGMQFGPTGSFNILMNIGLFIILILYVLRQFKGLMSAILIRGFNLIYFFIYLCAVEMAPILILLKLVSVNA